MTSHFEIGGRGHFLPSALNVVVVLAQHGGKREEKAGHIFCCSFSSFGRALELDCCLQKEEEEEEERAELPDFVTFFFCLC